MSYFGEPVGRDKIQTTIPNWYVRASEFRGYLKLHGMRNISMRSGTELAQEIKLTDWSMTGNLSNRSSGVQIPRDICTRLKRYLYSAKCSWIIMGNIGPWFLYGPRCARSVLALLKCYKCFAILLVLN